MRVLSVHACVCAYMFVRVCIHVYLCVHVCAHLRCGVSGTKGRAVWGHRSPDLGTRGKITEHGVLENHLVIVFPP